MSARRPREAFPALAGRLRDCCWSCVKLGSSSGSVVRIERSFSLNRVLPKFQHSLGQTLKTLYTRTGIADVYNRALGILQELIAATPLDYSQRHKYLNTLAQLYYYNFPSNGDSI